MYRIRLMVVALFFMAGTLITGALFIAPSYFIVLIQAQELKAQRAMQQTQTDTDSDNLKKLLVQADQRIALLGAKYAHMPVTDRMGDIVQKQPEGITLSSLRYDRTDAGAETLIVAGRSASRDALVSFQELLQKQPYVKSVTLPISDLASSADIDFTITATLNISSS